MAQIITYNGRKPDNWPWSYTIRVYNAGAGKQLDFIQGANLKSKNIQRHVRDKTDKLIRDIAKSFQTG